MSDASSTSGVWFAYGTALDGCGPEEICRDARRQLSIVIWQRRSLEGD
ncbi:MAG: hypothetical protein OXG85_09995 [Chloroflexi bacterium]|nr:hypothetical protein [Chloroflexota bacterium]